MNATEHLVEAYYRFKGHFTVTDVKVEKGNNRQFDLLTFDGSTKKNYHIEANVTHSLNWQKDLENLTEESMIKFFGVPRNNRPENEKTDFIRGKTYLDSIKETYKKFNIDYDSVVRVWCVWSLKTVDKNQIQLWKEKMSNKSNLKPENFEILLFRDEVLDFIMGTIGTSNYDDEILRTLSLLKEFGKQTSNN